jgi:hypothetical protein
MKVILYDSFEKKRALELELEKNPVIPTPTEALIKTLDLMDFYARFSKKRTEEKSNIPWIILQWKNKEGHAIK